MTNEDILLLNDLKANVQQLFSEYNRINSEKEELRNSLLALQKEIESLKQEKLELSLKFENLKLAKQISSNEVNNGEARQRINKLVREIDKCIALLNK